MLQYPVVFPPPDLQIKSEDMKFPRLNITFGHCCSKGTYMPQVSHTFT